MNECNIVKDLMPLYTEQLLSEDSMEYIHRHIAWCESCREALRLSGQELPEIATDAYISEKKAIKKALRRDRLRTALQTILCFSLFVIMVVCYMGYQMQYYLTPIEVALPAPDGTRTLELVERDYIGCRTDGYMIRFNFDDAGHNRYYTEWDAVDAHWAPDSEHLYLDITTLEGVREVRVLNTTTQMTSGGTQQIPGLSEDLLPSIRTAAEAHLGQAVEEITFAAWADDSQTLLFSAATADGNTHPIRFHFPSGSIVP